MASNHRGGTSPVDKSAILSDCAIFDCGKVELQSGGYLPNLKLAYKSYGTLSKDKRNVVLLPTFYGGLHTRNESLFGRGRAIDPAHHFIISINLIGNGLSSSPSNTPHPFAGPDFPPVTINDNVRLQQRLLVELWGLKTLSLVTGWSMAGCQSYEWGAQFPEMVRALLPFCASAKTSVHNIVFLEGVKAALLADPEWNNGKYTRAPERGLRAFGRVYAGWAYSQTFYREALYRQLGFKSYAELLADWERDHLAWDANDLLAMLWTWQKGDISDNAVYRGDFPRALAAISAKSILLPCTQDLYFPPADNAIELQHMPNAQLRPIDSPWGHSAGSPGRDPAFSRMFDQCAAELLSV